VVINHPITQAVEAGGMPDRQADSTDELSIGRGGGASQGTFGGGDGWKQMRIIRAHVRDTIC
jgi:hypothetical protein